MSTFEIWALCLSLLPAVLVWAWLAAGVVEQFVPLSTKARYVVIIAWAGAAALILFVSFNPTAFRDPGNPPVPCVGDGVDFDTRDGLCYKHVPLQFQRR
jgi:hypothetical protein